MNGNVLHLLFLVDYLSAQGFLMLNLCLLLILHLKLHYCMIVTL